MAEIDRMKTAQAASHDTGELPRVSVVVPCHNESGNLGQLISEICQAVEPTGNTYEIVLVDGASTDGTWAMWQRFGAENSRVRGLRFVQQCGQSAAMWAGMQHARGEVMEIKATQSWLILRMFTDYIHVAGSARAGANRSRGTNRLDLGPQQQTPCAVPA
jgi:cellulose synthase/poly-beta-1,6-N-acetylglucosamine synthase-like glycosyltransferase